MELSRAAVLLCALAVLALAVGRASAQDLEVVNCYRSLPCGGPDFFEAASIQECCLHPDGLIVEPDPGDEACLQCVVFGWTSGNPDPDNSLKRIVSFIETGERQQLTVGFSKGIPITDSYDVRLRGTVTEGTATEGATRDFRLEGDINAIDVSFLRSGGVETGGPITNVPVIIQIDNVALEPEEDFTLTFEVIAQSPGNILTGGAVILVNELQVFIEDRTVFQIQFTEFDYSQDEDRGSLPVAVRLSAEIASSVTLSIVKRNLTEVYSARPGGGVEEPPVIPLPDGFAVLDPFIPARPYIASSVDGLVATVDYNTSIQSLTFTPGPERTIVVPVEVFDDRIDEADEEYFVLFLESDDSRVNLMNGRFASRGIIRDNERTTIGFEMARYTFSENRIPPFAEIFIIKEDNRQSELTFSIRILLSTGTGVGFATLGVGEDFIAVTERTEEFRPEEVMEGVDFILLDDSEFEGDEIFQYEIANADVAVPFDTSIATTTIVIEDNEDVIIGFEETEFSVSEDQGPVELCLVVLSPGPEVNLTRSYLIGAESVQGTAGAADYGEFVGGAFPRLFFTNEIRRHCFNVTITDDGLFEGSESFTVEAREDPPFFDDIDGLTLHPNRSTATITIIDQDTLVIGYVTTAISVEEDGGSVDVTATVLEGSLGTSVDITSATADGTAVSGDDYNTTIATATFSQTVDSLVITVPIVNDIVPEDPESFSACLTFADEADLILRGLRERITLLPDKAEINITDDDEVVTIGLEEVDYPVDEGDGEVTVCTVVISPDALQRDAEVTFCTGDDTAVAGEDYTATTVPLTFNATVRRVCVSIPIIDDIQLESPEQFVVSLKTTDPLVILDPDNGTVTITDNEQVVTIGLEEVDYPVDEGDGEVTVCTVVISPDDDLQRDAEVTFCTGDDTAVAGEDYTAVTVPLTFNATVRRVCVSIPIIDDIQLEDTEQFVVSLKTTDPLVILDPDEGTVTITDNDEEVEFSFELRNYTFIESAGGVAIAVDKDGIHTSPITVRVFGGPSAQTNIVQSAPAIDATLTFTSGDTRLPAFLRLTDDIIALEAVESYLMTLELVVATTGARIVDPDTATLNVLDDDVVTVRFSERLHRVREGMGPVEICLTRDLASLRDVIVTITTVDGTANSPADYLPLVSVPVDLGTAADSEVCVPIDIVSDNVTELEEFFTVVIDAPLPSGVRVGVPDTASVIIEDSTVLVVVNDTVDADPVLTVPLHITNLADVGMDGRQLSMCFELWGRPNNYFNLVTDECLSANAYYTEVEDSGIHIITAVAIRATDNFDTCHNIAVDRDMCSVTVDGVPQTMYNSGGISVRTSFNRVRVSVPNCDERTVVIYMLCRNNTFWADEETPVAADFLFMRVVRGLNFGHRDSHGIIGQYWNVDTRIAPYTGSLKSDVSDGKQRFSITLRRQESGRMQTFTGELGEFRWDGVREPCLFVGNAQAGPVYEVNESNDGVIEGSYADYIVSQPFSESGYRFGRFDEARCQ